MEPGRSSEAHAYILLRSMKDCLWTGYTAEVKLEGVFVTIPVGLEDEHLYHYSVLLDSIVARQTVLLFHSILILWPRWQYNILLLFQFNAKCFQTPW